MQSIFAIMHDHHKRCDQLFAAAEEALDQNEDFSGLTKFNEEMNLHFTVEEEVLFPAFEELTGMHDRGPTEVMRIEHAQMKGLMADMGATQDAEQAVNLGETLMILMQQHNLKEENMLYPMFDQQLDITKFMDKLTPLFSSENDPTAG